MNINTILIIGFLLLASLLWEILKTLISINLRSENIREHLFEIESQNRREVDLRGAKLVDLSDIKDSLDKISSHI